MKSLFNAVGETQILKMRKIKGIGKKSLLIGEREIEGARLDEMSAMARLFLKSELYSVVNASIKATLNESMFKNSKSDQDIFFGKASLWFMDVFERTIKEVAESFDNQGRV